MDESNGELKITRRQQVLRLAEQGNSNADIARTLGISAKSVQNLRNNRPVTAGSPLTKREAEIADLARQGLTNILIGEKLCISSRTVEIFRQRAIKKLGVRNAAELATAYGSKEIAQLNDRIAELEKIIETLRKELGKHAPRD